MEDLLSFEQLRKRTLYEMMSGREETKQPDFVGEDWLGATCGEFVTRVNAEDGDVEDRVRPGAVIGCSRSGKSRALRELGERLRTEKGVNVIYVSFNDATPYDVNEASSPLESLLARIAYALVKPGLRDKKRNRRHLFTTPTADCASLCGDGPWSNGLTATNVSSSSTN